MFMLEHATFFTETKGDASSFSGSEWHETNGIVVYRFDFHGGRVLFE
jgi:hypothetical protein